METTTCAPRPVLRRATFGLAVLGHLALAVPYAASGLLAPGWAVYGLWAVWAALLALLVHWRHEPLRALLVPVAGLGIILGTVTLGERVLGWVG